MHTVRHGVVGLTLIVAVLTSAGATPAASATNSLTFPTSSQLNGVACPTTSNCWAVGYAGLATGGNGNVVIRWNGTRWSDATVPQPSGLTSRGNQVLYDTTCAGAHDCWAVGYQADPAGRPLNETLHWDGRAWKLISSPQPSRISQILYSVSCATTADCWAVGMAMSGPEHPVPEALHWNGRAWSVSAIPSAAAGGASAQGVTCRTSSFCLAVGWGQTASDVLLDGASTWTGTSWTTSRTPQPAGRTAESGGQDLQAVTCPATNTCWAVGAAQPSAWTRLNQVLRWDGRAWQVAATPQPTGLGRNGWQELNGVSCASRTDCWAVGDTDGSTEANEVLHWDGSHWAVAAVPQPSGRHGQQLQAVACATPADCWAVGMAVDAGGSNRSEALRWNGATWLAVSVPGEKG